MPCYDPLAQADSDAADRRAQRDKVHKLEGELKLLRATCCAFMRAQSFNTRTDIPVKAGVPKAALHGWWKKHCRQDTRKQPPPKKMTKAQRAVQAKRNSRAIRGESE